MTTRYRRKNGEKIMIIEFRENQHVIKKVSGGFAGSVNHSVVEVLKDKPFEVLEIIKHHKCCAVDIFVHHDGCCDGYGTYLINVPKSFLRIVES